MTPQGGGNLSQTNTGDRLVTVLNFPVDNERTATTRVKWMRQSCQKRTLFRSMSSEEIQGILYPFPRFKLSLHFLNPCNFDKRGDGLGSITRRCLGNEPALSLPCLFSGRTNRTAEIEPRDGEETWNV